MADLAAVIADQATLYKVLAQVGKVITAALDTTLIHGQLAEVAVPVPLAATM